MRDDDLWLFTLHDVAEHLGVSETTVRRLTDRGELPYIRVGKQRRYRREDIAVYLERQTRKAVPGGR